MAIYRLISNGSFGPDEIKVMTAAYEAALIDLAVTNRDDPVTELIARAIVNITATGERELHADKGARSKCVRSAQARSIVLSVIGT